MKSLIFSASLLGITLFASCGEKPAPKKDTTPKVEVRSLGGLKIAYYSNDSIKANFAFFVKEEGIIKKKQKSPPSIGGDLKIIREKFLSLYIL
jgi:hypothetical protein